MYNPFGQRILKIVKPRPGGVASNQPDWDYYYYTYDANGQVMAVYELKMDPERYKATLDEQHLYGAARLGMIKPERGLYDNGVISYPPQEINQNTLGETYYEISNYLGNVNVVITDRKTVDVGGGATSLFVATEVSTSDFYPFGMTMPGREDNVGGYRYGYNGMEFDTEVKGNQNSYTTEFRQYDPRLGRWLSLDPLMAKYPSMSPYISMNNNPVFFVDPLGLEGTDWVKGGIKSDGTVADANTWHWMENIKSQDEARGYLDYAAPGSIVAGHLTTDPSNKVGSVYLGENGQAGYIMDEVVVQANIDIKSEKINDSYSLSFQMSTEMVPSDGYDIANIGDLRANWNNYPRFCRGMGYVANGLAVAPAAFMALPALVEGGFAVAPYIGNGASTVGRLTIDGFKLYHNTVGLNGGYASAGYEAFNQSITQYTSKGTINLGDYDLIGIWTSSLIKGNTPLKWQLIQGASGGLGTYSINEGFKSSLLQKSSATTVGTTLNGMLAPLMGNTPLVKGIPGDILNEGVSGYLQGCIK